jgi:molybdopterin molybdotransferase
MTQLADDCFAFGGPLLKTADALALLDERIGPVAGTEEVPLRQGLDRILAADIVSGRAVPPHANAAVDGYAVRFDDLAPDRETRLPVTGRAAAGHPLGRTAAGGEAIRIFTGAPLPDGLDTVQMQEDCRPDHDHVILRPGLKRGANVRSAGEDIRAGATVLRRGRRLRPEDLGLAASIGCARLPVYRRLKAAVFSTGDELAEPGQSLPPGGIFDANRFALVALLEALGCDVSDLGILRDRFEPIRDGLAAAATNHDVILTSGGMSVGEEDHVKTAVNALGRLHFWQLAIKPGRPLGLGQIGSVPFVGLPGNPVAMMVTFLRIARPMILRLGGADPVEPHVFRVAADFAYKKKAGRREWVRARLVTAPDGTVRACKFPREGSGILSSLVEAHGLVELPEDLVQLDEGSPVDFLPFTEVSR